MRESWSLDFEGKKVAPGTRAANYRCSLPGLAGFASFASPRAIIVLAQSSGGERGIRTLGTLRHTRFPIVLLRPLGHLSSYSSHQPNPFPFPSPIPIPYPL